MNTPNFSDIYTLYFEDVYKYLLALCHDEELAEELAQDTFFKAIWKKGDLLPTAPKDIFE